MSDEEGGPDSDRHVIIKCTCKTKNQFYDVILANVELKWHKAGTELKDLETVRVVDILSVSLKKSTGSGTDDLCVTYVRQEKKFILKSCIVSFTSNDSQIIQNLHQQISTLVTKNAQRPRRLMVVINPMSGNGKGGPTYEQKVAPIFKEAGIETDVIVTEKAKHTYEILSTYDIKSVDGLVLVSGDENYHEGVNCLIRRLAVERGLDVDDPEETLPAIGVNIGVIPCGTGNGIAYACYGNKDVTTAALSIAIGFRSPANMMSVHCSDKLVAYSILLVGYGVWSDLIYISHSWRSYGRLRVLVAVLQMFIKAFRRMSLTIKYEIESLKTQVNKVDVDSRDVNGDEIENEGGGLQTQIINTDVNASDTIAVLDGAELTEDESKEVKTNDQDSNQILSTLTENATGSIIFLLAPVAADFTTHAQLWNAALYLNKSSKRMSFLIFLFRLMSLDKAAIESRDDIRMLFGQQWKVKLDEPSESGTRDNKFEHYLNIDGEVFRLPIPEYQAKLLTGKIYLYSNMPYATKIE